MYYNTTSVSGNTLKVYHKAAEKQDDLVLNLFTSNPEKEFTPEYAHEVLFTASVPLTSLRRSFNTLEKDSRIEKTGNMVIGNFGRPVNTYKLKTINNQLQIL
jgi:response regulator of citrate/malate metabolism